MQAAQQGHLQKLIETSPILSPSEKTEWLDMLILMNDKQAGELEQILNAQHAAPPVSAAPTPAAAVPPLAHISNLPSGLNSPLASAFQPAPRTPPPAQLPSQMPWQKQFEVTMGEKELPPGPLPTSSRTEPAAPRPRPSSRPAQAPTPAPPVAAVPPRPAAAPTSPPSASPGLETLANVGTLTLAAMRAMEPADLLIRLQQLAKMEGYFNVLSYLEDSPLYKSYIATGKQALAKANPFGQGEPASKDNLTKKEFETFTDILRKIQIN
jgi:hypothetical protein